ncbi:MAG: chemotaxis protein CheC [Nitrospiraceae bacterium]|nr:chemotaxis protein CheC [Nitrospiraceae bacterium]
MNPTEYQLDALRELINIGIGRAAKVLSEMVNARILLQVPFIKLLTPENLRREMGHLGEGLLAAVRLGFKGPFSGTAALVFPPDSASKLVAILTGEGMGTPDLDSVRVGTLSEVGNIVINGVMGSIANVLKLQINYTLPTYTEDNIENLVTPIDTVPDATVVLAHTRFTVEQRHIEGDIILIFELGSFSVLMNAINMDPDSRDERD